MIELKDISKYYDEQTPFLKNINLSAERSEILVLVGEEGCGKATMIRIMARMILPSGGEVNIGKKNLLDFETEELRTKIGFVTRDPGLLPHLTVSQNIGIMPSLNDWSDEQKEKAVSEALLKLGLQESGLYSKYPEEISRKEQILVAIARALACGAENLLLDETLDELQADEKDEIFSLAFRLRDGYEKTVIISTKSLKDALFIGDRIAIMKDGKIEQLGRPREILKHPKNDYIEYYVGKSRLWKPKEMLLAKDIMSGSIITIGENRGLIHAIELMRDKNTNILVVVEEERREKGKEKPLGLVGPKQIKKAFSADATMKDIMRRDIKTVGLESSLEHVLALRSEVNQYDIPVVGENRNIEGIITERSLLNVMEESFPDIEEVR